MQQDTIRVVTHESFQIRIDLSGQVLRLALPQGLIQEHVRLEPTLRGLLAGGNHFTSAAMLAQKGKQFDDGLYAAVELALQNGAGPFRGKRWLLQALTRELADLPASSSSLPGILFGAASFGGLDIHHPPHLASNIERATAGFLGDQTQSKPISFYTWSESLERIFRQDRMLQQELTGAAEIGALVQALRSTGAGPVYDSYLRFVARLTNPPPVDKPDLRAYLEPGAHNPPADNVYFFPPSRARETELVKKLFGAGRRRIPDGFDLAAAMIAGLRSGSMNLDPNPDSGWYDLQAWALAPLAAPEKVAEGKKLEFDQDYRGHLELLFKTLLALSRETHIKQLEITPAGALAPPQVPSFKLSPQVGVEPVYTYYLRRAAGYRFLNELLATYFGSGNLSNLHRLTAAGPVARDLVAELDEIAALYYGASVVAARELGLSEQERARFELSEVSRVPASRPLAMASAAGPAADAARFQAWARDCDKDSDLAVDARMMVPVFYDIDRRKTRVWAFLGWIGAPLKVTFARPPAVEVFDHRNRPAGDKLRIEYIPNWHTLIVPVTVEMNVSTILDRREFQAFCDRHKTIQAILAHLGK